MKRVMMIMVALAVLVLPAVASAYTSFPASISQTRGMEKSAAATHPCGYSGKTQELSDFRVLYFEAGKVRFNVGSAHWTLPSEAPDYCDLIFVAEPGFTLSSLATTKHPYVAWAPLTWGSSPFEDTSAFDGFFSQWFPQISSPNWVAVSRAFS